ncbi:gamma-glutamyl-gamma-aminobutyrate hydrolase family protein [Vogesella sp. LYT5W]|uniref:Gamma-glutamyl-gamma-aminobutyrate hydrolase family protein n=1 Tax=Vogesella margarita TaxID=2984199 RepID=A0ABT5IQ74_9NEIS|nr:gamma-glutamyl-gamma-aminobutyrate hydrolase family protein [Vogesella margarita]MDC7714673.1 gamma-glutamyl-gamma-aminobutyrate hydrolase family protein [Vogesella margarita]
MTTPLKIGLSARIYHPQPGADGLQSKTLQYLEQSVAHWVMSRDVMVLMIPTVLGDGMINRSSIRLADYARYLDGLVLQGGADLSPRSYGEEPLHEDWHGDAVRDAYEMELFHEFVEAGKPVLGICRGAQLINVALGGTLYQDIPSQLGVTHHQHSDYDSHAHDIVLTPASQLADLLGGQAGKQVISIHHQAIRALGRGLLVEARASDDGLIEAVRLDDDNFVCGLQWHPEFHPPGAAHLLDCTPVLDRFLLRARERSRR